MRLGFLWPCLAAMAACHSASPSRASRFAAAPVDATKPYFEFQVDKQATLLGRVSLKYPEELRLMNIEGGVLCQWLVDTTGRADMTTFKVLKSTHDGFTEAVKMAIAHARYRPAEIRGRKVMQLVQQPFNFTLTREP